MKIKENPEKSETMKIIRKQRKSNEQRKSKKIEEILYAIKKYE